VSGEDPGVGARSTPTLLVSTGGCVQHGMRREAILKSSNIPFAIYFPSETMKPLGDADVRIRSEK
jgi:hypothetical protein